MHDNAYRNDRDNDYDYNDYDGCDDDAPTLKNRVLL
jgi:hypothetical protein